MFVYFTFSITSLFEFELQIDSPLYLAHANVDDFKW